MSTKCDIPVRWHCLLLVTSMYLRSFLSTQKQIILQLCLSTEGLLKNKIMFILICNKHKYINHVGRNNSLVTSGFIVLKQVSVIKYLAYIIKEQFLYSNRIYIFFIGRRLSCSKCWHLTHYIKL